MQISRLFEIVYLLMNKKNMTAKELAAHFEVSIRTILRDIDTLTTAGIPIYTTQGKGGGISILDSYILNKTVLSEDEQNQILFALQGLSATHNIDTDNILVKLQSLFEKADSNWIEVDFSRWGNSVTDKAKFDCLKNAIIKKQALAFNYSNSYGETRDRKVYPLKLAFKSKSWYLQAFCLPKENYRTFKVNRMRNIETIDETFSGMAFQIPEMDSTEYQSPCLLDVKLLFSPHVAYRVYDEFDEKDITKNEDGSFVVAMKLPNDYWLYDYILSFGDSIEVLEPQSVRNEIVKQVDKIKKKYLNKT
ncbi:MAG TPA: YafY family protein [Pseudobacteroides sp.]|uniref:helix-turn-helix transcriptional regulator n=1 Tax=Pseudobacteroides sp. TaxID=1968840 RepID=UPI002F95D1C0